MMESTEAQNPLDLPGADVTLVSSDNVHFRVHRIVLSLASPFFQSMFALPEDRTHTPDSGDITMVETSAVLSPLLRYIYPISPKPIITSIDEAALLIQTARKLDLETVVQEIVTQVEVVLSSYDNPFLAWAHAVRFGADDVRKTSIIQIIGMEDMIFRSMLAEAQDAQMYVTGKDLYMLMTLRESAIAKIRGALQSFSPRDLCGRGGRKSRIIEDLPHALGSINPLSTYCGDMALLRLLQSMPQTCDCSACGKEPFSDARQAEFVEIRVIYQRHLREIKDSAVYLGQNRRS